MSEFVIVLMKSLVIGSLIGLGAGWGAARMFHAPRVQGAGAFRTIGELNACQGDAFSHGSFGFGFLISSWASAVSTGMLSQDVDHRVIPNFAAAVLMRKGKTVEETLHNPKLMAISGAIIGAIVLAFLNSTAAAVPESLKMIASAVLVPASNILIATVMPIIFILAAFDAGKKCGIWAIALGGASQLIMGNAVPGVVLGIIMAKVLEDSGWNKLAKYLLVSIIALFILSSFFRGFDIKLIEQFQMTVPNWLNNLHNLFNIGG